MWVTSRTGSVGWDLWKVSQLSSRSEEDCWLSGFAEARPVALQQMSHVLWGRWKSHYRKNVYLSSYVEKPFNSKVIKSFVPELRNRKSFFLCFGIPMLSIHEVWTFYVRFTYPYHGYGTCMYVFLLAIKYSTWKCAWCNGYRRRKWTRWHEFKSWTRLIAFHIALISLGKVWIQLFSLQLWVNSRADYVLQPWLGN